MDTRLLIGVLSCAVAAIKIYFAHCMTLRRAKLSRAFNGIYTLLCAVLRARWIGGVSDGFALLLRKPTTQRSNIAHNKWPLFSGGFETQN